MGLGARRGQLSYLCTGVEKKGIWALAQDFLRLLSGGLKVRVSGAAGSRRVGEQKGKGQAGIQAWQI